MRIDNPCKWVLKGVLAFLLVRVLFFFAKYYPGGPLYVILVNNIQDILYGWCIYYLLQVCKMNKKGQSIINVIFIYLCSFTIIMLYPLLPPSVFKMIGGYGLLWAYNCIFLITFGVLFMRYKYFSKRNLL